MQQAEGPESVVSGVGARAPRSSGWKPASGRKAPPPTVVLGFATLMLCCETTRFSILDTGPDSLS